jgi:hypothetical protein
VHPVATCYRIRHSPLPLHPSGPQLTEGSYDFVANKTLLKLYLLFPGHATADKVSKVRCTPNDMSGMVHMSLRVASPNLYHALLHVDLNRSCLRPC